MSVEMNAYWASVYLPTEIIERFEYHGPWWISGGSMQGREALVAAVMARSEEEAIETLRLAIDEAARPDSLEVRFVDKKPWLASEAIVTPGGRFVLKGWMRWPWPVNPLEPRPASEGP